MLMRPLYVFFQIVFVLLALPGRAQHDEDVKLVKRAVFRIDSLGNYSTKQVEDSCFEIKGRALRDTLQTITGYYKKQQLVKIVYVQRFSDGRSSENLYFEAGELIFVRVLTEIYPRRKDGNLQNVYIPKVAHKAAYFFRNGELLELHNFGKGPMDALRREEKREVLKRKTGLYRIWLVEENCWEH